MPMTIYSPDEMQMIHEVKRLRKVVRSMENNLQTEYPQICRSYFSEHIVKPIWYNPNNAIVDHTLSTKGYKDWCYNCNDYTQTVII